MVEETSFSSHKNYITLNRGNFMEDHRALTTYICLSHRVELEDNLEVCLPCSPRRINKRVTNLI